MRQVKDVEVFQNIVWAYYAQNKRDLPWRRPPYDPYRILVSEVMLQQTQVTRVIPKYLALVSRFPNIEQLAHASLADVMTLWNGLGYNRRAKYLHDAAKQLITTGDPWTLEDLTARKGIGLNTAAAVMTYAYNQPVGFVETNIRTVYIHHFAAELGPVTDKEILQHVERTLDHTHPREFMWALMDYGSYLKRTVGNTAANSQHYTKQGAFIGSRRHVRGQIIKALINRPQSFNELRVVVPDTRVASVLQDLRAEQLITVQSQRFILAS